MPIEQALEELKKYANDLTSIGDAKEFIKNNKEEFLRKWQKVMQYYIYIIKNQKTTDDQYKTAMDIVDDIRADNETLNEWVELIISGKSEKKQNETQKNQSIDTSAIANKIESYVNEIKNMQYWNPSHIEDIEWALQEYRKLLLSNKNYFDNNLYQSLMDDIGTSLDKIQKFYNTINSDTMQSIRRM